MFEGLSYQLTLTFPSNYPCSPPTIKFVTPCFHPNVDQHGNICLDILQDKWSAVYDVRSTLVSLRSLLSGGFKLPCPQIMLSHDCEVKH